MAVYRLKARGPKVGRIQKALNQRLGFGHRIQVTGVYDEPTFQAVEQFQRQNDLKKDGIVGPQTLGALFSSTFLYLHRSKVDEAKGVTLGRMYVSEGEKAWQFLCYTYELPLILDNNRTRSRKSCVKPEKSYPLKVRTDGPKGWRLQLSNTDHRKYVQIHRASWKLGSLGCILPIDLSTFNQLRRLTIDGQLTREEKMSVGNAAMEDISEADIKSEQAQVRKEWRKRRPKLKETAFEKIAKTNLSGLSTRSITLMDKIKSHYDASGFGSDSLAAATLHISQKPPAESIKSDFSWHLISRYIPV